MEWNFSFWIYRFCYEVIWNDVGFLFILKVIVFLLEEKRVVKIRIIFLKKVFLIFIGKVVLYFSGIC